MIKYFSKKSGFDESGFFLITKLLPVLWVLKKIHKNGLEHLITFVPNKYNIKISNAK